MPRGRRRGRPRSSVLPAWNVQGMNAVKPPVSSCRSRMRRRCSIRSASVSSEPNIMVAVVFMPRPWATRMTFSHVSVGILCGLMAVRTRSTRISAPPPGSAVEAGGVEPRQRLLHGQVALLRDVHDLRRRSQWMWIGYLALMPRNTSSNQQMSRSGCSPPCIMMAVPPSASVSSILRWMSSCGEQVALPAPRLLVEGAEAAAGEAVVRVVDVAVDDEGDLVAGVEAATDGVGARAGAQQVAALEQRERLRVGDAAGGTEGVREAVGSVGCAAHEPASGSRNSWKGTRWSPCGPRSGSHRHAADLIVAGRTEKPSAV